MFRLALPIVFLACAVIVAAPIPKDDSDAGRMQRIYGSVFDPKEGVEFRPSGGSLHIKLPRGKKFLLAPQHEFFNAPRVLRDVKGDFTATVRVSFPIRSEVPAKFSNIREGWAGGGLVVWLDNANFLTVTRDEKPFGKTPGEYFRSEARSKLSVRGESEAAETGTAGYVRVSRLGNRFVGSYSTDGKKWKHFGKHDFSWEADTVVKVGVIAENGLDAPFELIFDEYVLAPACE
jgi:regulation of enolase protein 1 (concanavalin A-like superfamily)